MFYPAAALAMSTISPELRQLATSPVPEAGLCWSSSVNLLLHPVRTTSTQHSSQSATGQQPLTSEALGKTHWLLSSSKRQVNIENFQIIFQKVCVHTTDLLSAVRDLQGPPTQPPEECCQEGSRAAPPGS